MVSKLISLADQADSGIFSKQSPHWPTLRLLLAAVVLVPLGILGLGAWLAWTQAWRQAEAELARTADAAAEYAAHLLDSHLLLADRVDDLLRGMTDEEIRPRGGYDRPCPHGRCAPRAQHRV